MTRGRYRIFREGGHGLSRYGCFILGHFIVGYIMWCVDKIPSDKMPADKTPVKMAREDNMLVFLGDREDKMPVLSKHLVFCTEKARSRKKTSVNTCSRKYLSIKALLLDGI